jgi:hypothetical protein
MKAVIFAPGPGLSAFPTDTPRDVTLGINRAVNAVPCDYAVILDHEAWPKVQPKGKPIWVCLFIQHDEGIEKGNQSADYPWVDIQSIRFPRPILWSVYSTTAAIAMACHLGATEIETWGVDWNGCTDWDGKYSSELGRSEDRWRCERAMCHVIATMAEARGCTVRRMPYDEPLRLVA